MSCLGKTDSWKERLEDFLTVVLPLGGFFCSKESEGAVPSPLLDSELVLVLLLLLLVSDSWGFVMGIKLVVSKSLKFISLVAMIGSGSFLVPCNLILLLSFSTELCTSCVQLSLPKCFLNKFVFVI